jgi:sulfatase maturation enzyme AslB (radical SAM superfamily)
MKQSNLYCILADKGLGLHNSGRTYLCCHSRKYLEDAQGEQIYLDTHTLEQAWASPTRREIQESLENNQEHASCQACWDDEHAGKKSRRQWHNSMNHPVTDRDDQPQIFDLKMGNTCNMKCRTCNPEVSSQWYREDWELSAQPAEGVSYSEYLKRWRRIPASYTDSNQDLWNTMSKWIPNAVYIDYYGAEPMLIKKNFEVLQTAVDQGTASKIDLHFSTNGTIWDDELETLLKQFRRVYFDLSIDDIGDRCGYIRYSSTWDLVAGNLERFLQAQRTNKNFQFGVCITVNSLNIYYLDEIFDFFAKKGLGTNFNMLHLPFQLCVKSLPADVKQAITDKLSKYVPDNIGLWHQQYWKDHCQIVLNFLNTPMEGQAQHFREFHRYTRGLDRSRDQCFETVLPEFAALIKPWFAPLDQLLVVDSPAST